VELIPVNITSKGDLIFVPDSNFDENPSSNSVPDIPPKPKLSNLSTPSTMTGLFPDQLENVTLNSITESEQSKRLTLDLAERKLRVIDSVRFNKSISKPTFCGKISSGLNYVDSHLRSKLLNKSTGNTDLISQEMAEERRRKKRERELERQAFYTMLS
jgi:hypothetical protein